MCKYVCLHVCLQFRRTRLLRFGRTIAACFWYSDHINRSIGLTRPTAIAGRIGHFCRIRISNSFRPDFPFYTTPPPSAYTKSTSLFEHNEQRGKGLSFGRNPLSCLACLMWSETTPISRKYVPIQYYIYVYVWYKSERRGRRKRW